MLATGASIGDVTPGICGSTSGDCDSGELRMAITCSLVYVTLVPARWKSSDARVGDDRINQTLGPWSSRNNARPKMHGCKELTENYKHARKISQQQSAKAYHRELCRKSIRSASGSGAYHCPWTGDGKGGSVSSARGKHRYETWREAHWASCA